jgi:holo-[acyl-carrier protein] synthase
MKIYGIGTDVVNIKRMDATLKRKGNKFKKRIFLPKEITYCERKKNSSSYYAKRFAAKEAFSKALGTGISSGINFIDIEVINDNSGKPEIKVMGTTLSYLKKKFKKKKYKIYLSLSDDAPWAQATVLISY